MSDRTDPFEWSGGHPALDFVNTLDERPFDSPIENLSTYAGLVQFAELAGLVEPAIAARCGSSTVPNAPASPSARASCGSTCTTC